MIRGIKMVSKKVKGIILVIFGAALLFFGEQIIHDNEILLIAVGFIGFVCLLDGLFDLYNYFK